MRTGSCEGDEYPGPAVTNDWEVRTGSYLLQDIKNPSRLSQFSIPSPFFSE